MRGFEMSHHGLVESADNEHLRAHGCRLPIRFGQPVDGRDK